MKVDFDVLFRKIANHEQRISAVESTCSRMDAGESISSSAFPQLCEDNVQRMNNKMALHGWTGTRQVVLDDLKDVLQETLYPFLDKTDS